MFMAVYAYLAKPTHQGGLDWMLQQWETDGARIGHFSLVRFGPYQNFDEGRVARDSGSVGEMIGVAIRSDPECLRFEHWVHGKAVRRIAYEQEKGGWTRSEGTPEPWESNVPAHRDADEPAWTLAKARAGERVPWPDLKRAHAAISAYLGIEMPG